jgi:hypothetical protein
VGPQFQSNTLDSGDSSQDFGGLTPRGVRPRDCDRRTRHLWTPALTHCVKATSRPPNLHDTVRTGRHLMHCQRHYNLPNTYCASLVTSYYLGTEAGNWNSCQVAHTLAPISQ